MELKRRKQHDGNIMELMSLCFCHPFIVLHAQTDLQNLSTGPVESTSEPGVKMHSLDKTQSLLTDVTEVLSYTLL